MIRIKSSELDIKIERLRRLFTARRGPIWVALFALVMGAEFAVWAAVAHDSLFGLLISAAAVSISAWAIILVATSEGR